MCIMCLQCACTVHAVHMQWCTSSAYAWAGGAAHPAVLCGQRLGDELLRDLGGARGVLQLLQVGHLHGEVVVDHRQVRVVGARGRRCAAVAAVQVRGLLQHLESRLAVLE